MEHLWEEKESEFNSKEFKGVPLELNWNWSLLRPNIAAFFAPSSLVATAGAASLFLEQKV
ncbi:uncharacterized protein ASCRUDRAFT_82565 [Ascoidea rubescens DSM 1968]|uniref:Uncharacterized protein n=1 Tax=Ascoidea rubescens DSM 1968 TaxID=1344418 RepID=A0A1D2VAK1_9ASCO|nr:hypothetical protein ASCRUDRAFT_82565 [Ascoidea rubescens DSM 1968]ODV58640.1 hypothetical protein ASCRUDRAFT_82565 [Ascoidea rubescens DSM 1968]